MRNVFKGVSVRKIIILMFTVEVLIFAIIIGYLAYISGGKTIMESARETSLAVNSNVSQLVQEYMGNPYRIEKINAHIILNKQIEFSNQLQLDTHFVEMLKISPGVINNYVILETGDEFGARNEDDGSFLVWSSNKEKQTLDYYTYDEQLGRQDYVKSLTAYVATSRPPYLRAIEMGKPGWTKVFNSATGRGLVITRTRPLYDDDKSLIGVISSSLLLNRFNDFLKKLDITEHSSVFILSKEGVVIADDGEQTAPVTKETPLRLADDNPLLAKGFSALKAKVGLYEAFDSYEECSFDFNGEKFFLHAIPIRIDDDVQWLNVILIPEKDLTQGLQRFLQQLIIIIIIAFCVALMNGIWIARYIVNPLIMVNLVTKKIAEGDFSPQIEMNRKDEVGQLVQSVNEMAIKLKNQFELEKKAAEAERKMRELAIALNQTARVISSKAELNQMLEKIIDVLLTNTRAQDIYFLVEKDGQFEIKGEGHSNDHLISILQRPATNSDSVLFKVVNYVAKTHEIIVINNVAADGRFVDDNYSFTKQYKSVMCLSVLSKGELKGIIYLANNLIENAFGEQEVEIGSTVASQLALSIENAYLYTNMKDLVVERTKELNEEIVVRTKAEGRLEEMANLDYLTNLPNRRRFQEILNQSITFSNNLNTRLAIVFVDLDGFKAINDRYGHDKGDLSLVLTAKRLIEAVRSGETDVRTGDTVSRMGGDEFVIILENVKSVSEIDMICNRITKLIGEPIIIDSEGTEVRFTASLGVSIKKFDGDNAEDLITNADKAMYIAKKSGKNQIVYHSQRSSLSNRSWGLLS